MDWTRVSLDDTSFVEIGTTELPDFDALWALHPEMFPLLVLYGRPVLLPRWQQAYGEDYRFSGQLSRGEPVPLADVSPPPWPASGSQRR